MIMERLDPEMKQLAAEIKSPNLIDDQKKKIEEKMRKREEILAPMYHQVAVQFADLHDTPKRMLEKGVIRGIVKWEDARTTLYWRLRRRLLETQLTNKIKELNGRLSQGQSYEMLRRWFIEDKGENQRFLWEQDRSAVDWLHRQTLEDQRLSLIHI